MKNANISRIAAAIAVAVLLGGCGGSHSTNPLPTVPQKPVSGSQARATVTIHIPAPSAQADHRKPAWISPNTQSVGFAAQQNGGSTFAPQYVNVSPGSPGCTTTGGSTTCSATFTVVPGDIIYTVTTYDKANGAGNLLAQAQAETTFVANTDNKFSITLNGVPAKLNLSLQESSVPAGATASVPVTFSAYDADGNLIVGSPGLSDPNSTSYNLNDGVTITSSDNNEFALQQSGSSNISYPFTGLTVNYNGGVAKDAVITAQLGTTSLNTTATLHVGAAENSAALVYAVQPPDYVNTFIGTAGGYPGAISGSSYDVAPLTYPSTSCTNSGTFSTFARDANNDIAYAVSGPCGSFDIIGQPPGGPAAYAITSMGAGDTLALQNIVAIGFDSSNDIYYYADYGELPCQGCTTHIGSVRSFKAGSTGTANVTMDGPGIDCINSPEGLAVAPDGTLYVASIGNAHTNYEVIDVFAAGTNGQYECNNVDGEYGSGSVVNETRYIGGTNSGLNNVKQIALDSSGYVYAANDNANSITVYGPSANGNVAPDRTISGADTGLNKPTGVAVDKFGDVYVLNASGIVTVYAPGASGDATPLYTNNLQDVFLSGNIGLVY